MHNSSSQHQKKKRGFWSYFWFFLLGGALLFSIGIARKVILFTWAVKYNGEVEHSLGSWQAYATAAQLFFGVGIGWLLSTNSDRVIRKLAEQVDRQGKLKEVSSYRVALEYLEKIVKDCDPKYSNNTEFRNLYILNPTEWFGHTLNYNVDALLGCRPANRKKMLESRTPDHLFDAIEAVRKQIHETYALYVELRDRTPAVEVHYATLASTATQPTLGHLVDRFAEACQKENVPPSKIEKIVRQLRINLGVTSPFHHHYLEAVTSNWLVRRFVQNDKLAEIWKDLKTTNPAIDTPDCPAQLYLLDSGSWIKKDGTVHEFKYSKLRDLLKPSPGVAPDHAIFEGYLLSLQDDLRTNAQEANINQGRKFRPYLLDEVPFHIFMSLDEVPGRLRGKCLFLFANKYSLPNAEAVTGFYTEDPVFLESFFEIYRRVIKNHCVHGSNLGTP